MNNYSKRLYNALCNNKEDLEIINDSEYHVLLAPYARVLDYTITINDYNIAEKTLKWFSNLYKVLKSVNAFSTRERNSLAADQSHILATYNAGLVKALDLGQVNIARLLVDYGANIEAAILHILSDDSSSLIYSILEFFTAKHTLLPQSVSNIFSSYYIYKDLDKYLPEIILKMIELSPDIWSTDQVALVKTQALHRDFTNTADVLNIYLNSFKVKLL